MDNIKNIVLIQSSACIAETSTYPIDYVKTLMQLNNICLQIIFRYFKEREKKFQSRT